MNAIDPLGAAPPMNDTVTSLSLVEARRALGAGQLSPLELTQAHLKRIVSMNPRLNAFLEIAEESALQQARSATEALTRRASLGPLHGIPIAVKDVFNVTGMRTTAGSAFMRNRGEESFAIRKLREAGAIFLGKLNMHEWALGVTTINPHFGACVNPWSLEPPDRPLCIAGGSSGGSAAALAARLCMGSVGSDTGGSIRIPASLCGVVGLKPTYGRVSMSGGVPLSWSLDHACPMARTVEDVALLLQVMSGYDDMDPSSARFPDENFPRMLKARDSVRRLRVGVPEALFASGLHAETESAVRKAIEQISELGCEVHSIVLGDYQEAMEASATILLAEAAAFHRERLRDHADQFGPDVRGRLEQGARVTGTEYALARRTQSVWTRRMARLFEKEDALTLPATPIPATPIDGSDSVQLAGSVLTRFMRLFNLTGVPALALPCGFTTEGLPIGLQIVGPAGGEMKILQLGYAYEQSTDWYKREPKNHRQH